MIDNIIRSCLRHRFLVLIGLCGLVADGTDAVVKLQVDAFPHVTNVQVQVYTTWPGMSPRGSGDPGHLSPSRCRWRASPIWWRLRFRLPFRVVLITVVFADQVDLYFAGHWCWSASSPPKRNCQGGGALFRVDRHGLKRNLPAYPGEENPCRRPRPRRERRLMRLRTVQDAIVRPFLKTVPGSPTSTRSAAMPNSTRCRWTLTACASSTSPAPGLRGRGRQQCQCRWAISWKRAASRPWYEVWG